MKLQVMNNAIAVITALRPALAKIRRDDAALYKQIRDALNSSVLNIGEAEYSDSGNRKARFHTACGSASEARAGIRAACAWGYVGAPMVEPGLAELDRVIAILWKLTH